VRFSFSESIVNRANQFPRFFFGGTLRLELREGAWGDVNRGEIANQVGTNVGIFNCFRQSSCFKEDPKRMLIVSRQTNNAERSSVDCSSNNIAIPQLLRDAILYATPYGRIRRW
jgi:hypothetical protein